MSAGREPPLTTHNYEDVRPCLFAFDDRVKAILPRSAFTAVRLATSILRSKPHADLFCSLYTTRAGKPSLDCSHLAELVAKEHLITIDKIRHMAVIGADAVSSQPFRVHLNPLMLLEMQDRELDDEKGTNKRSASSLYQHPGPVKRARSEGNKEHQDEDEEEDEEAAPSTMTVFQKHVTMLTVLLVHHCDHLLFAALGRGIKPPAKKFIPTDNTKFTDVGHLMESSCTDGA